MPLNLGRLDLVVFLVYGRIRSWTFDRCKNMLVVTSTVTVDILGLGTWRTE